MKRVGQSAENEKNNNLKLKSVTHHMHRRNTITSHLFSSGWFTGCCCCRLHTANLRLLYIHRTPRMTTGNLLTDWDADSCESTMSSPGATSNPLNTLAPKRKTKKKHFVQQKVEVFRGSDPVLSVLMWGVNHSVGMSAA